MRTRHFTPVLTSRVFREAVVSCQHRPRRWKAMKPVTLERRTVLKSGIAAAGLLSGGISTEPATADTAQSSLPDQMKPIQAGDQLTADEIVNLLKLEPNATCGFVRQTFVSKQSIAAGVLPSPFADARPLG